MNTPNSQNRVSLDTEVLLVRRLFAFSNNTRPITSNYIPAISSNSEVKWYNTLENISTYGAGWLPDVHSNLSTVTGLTCNYLLNNLSNAASNLGFVNNTTFSNLSSSVNVMSNQFDSAITYISNIYIPTEVSNLSMATASLSNFMTCNIISTNVYSYQLLSATDKILGNLSSLSSFVSTYVYSNNQALTNLSTYVLATSNDLQNKINIVSNTNVNTTMFSNLSSYVGIISSTSYAYYQQNSNFELGTRQLLSNTNVNVASNTATISVASNVLNTRITGLSNYVVSFVVPVSGADLNSTTNGIFAHGYFTGNVGIFCNTPAYALDVNGTGNFATDVIIGGTGGRSLNSLSTNVTSNYSTLSSYVQSLSGTSGTNLSNLSTYALAISNYADSINGRVTGLSNYTTTLSNYTDTVNQKVTGLSNYTTNLSNYTDTVNQKVIGLCNYTVALSNYTNTVDGRVTGLSNYTTTLNTNFSNLSSYVNTISGDTTFSNYSTMLSYPNMTLSTLLVSAGSIGVGVPSRAFLSAAVDINNTDAAYRKLYVRNNTTPYLLVDADGQVGIGCNAPQYTLDVVGQMNITSNIMTPYVLQSAPRLWIYKSANTFIIAPGTLYFETNSYGSYPLVNYGATNNAQFNAPYAGLYRVELQATYQSDSGNTGPFGNIVYWIINNTSVYTAQQYVFNISGVFSRFTNNVVQYFGLNTNDELVFNYSLGINGTIEKPHLTIQYIGPN